MFKIMFRKVTRGAVAEAAVKGEPVCPETGLPFGEPGSTERLAWIFAMNDLEDAEERRLSGI